MKKRTLVLARGVIHGSGFRVAVAGAGAFGRFGSQVALNKSEADLFFGRADLGFIGHLNGWKRFRVVMRAKPAILVHCQMVQIGILVTHERVGCLNVRYNGATHLYQILSLAFVEIEELEN